MFLLDGRVVTSASDLTRASECEFDFLRRLDRALGRDVEVPPEDDPMLKRAGELGDRHEDRQLAAYRDEFGVDDVVHIDRPPQLTTETLASATDATRRAFDAGVSVVSQATFFDGSFVGFADFIVRERTGVYRVQDTKLARRAKVTALLQLVAYVEQLELLGIAVSHDVDLLLGDGSTSTHRVQDIRPVYHRRRARLLLLVEERIAAGAPVAWGDDRYTACGRCVVCVPEVELHRDLLLVAGMRPTQRARLREAGIRTIDELARLAVPTTGPSPVAGVARTTLATLHAQAELQVRAVEGEAPPVDVRDPSAFAAIPDPDAGDLFFDFEGDPLYTEGEGAEWGLDYLFGILDADEQFTAFWAHSFAEEPAALEAFLDLVELRLAAHPAMHIYHYASYERTHLLSIAARHGVGEARVDRLLRDGVFIDLYPIVRRGVLVGSHSYSIKKLEPLYMGDDHREGVTNAADSIEEYVRARALAEAGDAGEAQAVLDAIASYNRDDVVSTLRLRDWLLDFAASRGIERVQRAVREGEEPYEESALALHLRALARAESGVMRTADQQTLALAAAAIDYYPRERKSFFWGHYFRLEQPVEEWETNRDVLIVDEARVESDWESHGSRLPRRTLLLLGHAGPGSRFTEGAQLFALYPPNGPVRDDRAEPGHRIQRDVVVLEVLGDGLRVEESARRDYGTHDALPRAVVPGWPIKTQNLETAITEWAERIVAARPGWPADPLTDVVRRLPPRTRSGSLAPVVGENYVGAVVASLVDLDHSYLAVQGPPGTGKTYLAAHVITRLVRDHSWRVGVVAQSHAVVENVLDRLADAGIDVAVVGKAVKSGDAEHSFTTLARADDLADFIAERGDGGYVIGGTAWDFANPRRVERRSLDLLVIDEAGQFSLASTVGAGASARNLLLLGDPQQLPQVSQGIHPEPINESALGWIAGGHDVLPSEFGYFLAESRRMHPAVAAPVSELSYDNALRSHRVAAARHLDGVDPGLHPVPVVHHGDSVESIDEAREVLRIARSVLGRTWSDAPDAPSRPLGQADVIVVTPYNAQLDVVRGVLDAAGLTGVRVGTVDKFQGQEAVIAIVSLAASSAADVPRGMEFLIMRNRLNVAISRAQWAAWLVHSPALADDLPHTPQGVADLSAFIRLIS